MSDQNLFIVIALLAFGALLPDLDASESKVKHLSVGGIKPFMLPSQVIHQEWGHRTITHSLRGLMLTLSVSLLLGIYVGWRGAVALVLGYASHLLADACTVSGIPLFYPNRRRYHLLPKRWRLVTGSPMEELIFVLLSLTVITLLLLHLNP